MGAIEDLVLATFNIHHGEGRDGVVDIQRTATTMSGFSADLIALQEVDGKLRRSGGVDQAAELARATGMAVQFFPALLIEDGEYGLALAARDELNATAEPLPRHAGEERRIAVVARYRGLSVIATHLSRSPAARAVQIEFLATLAARLDPPVVVMGDLNQPVHAARPLLRAGFTTRPRPGSLRARLATRRIDHILVGPGARIRKLRTVATDVSDHDALVAVVSRRGT